MGSITEGCSIVWSTCYSAVCCPYFTARQGEKEREEKGGERNAVAAVDSLSVCLPLSFWVFFLGLSTCSRISRGISHLEPERFVLVREAVHMSNGTRPGPMLTLGLHDSGSSSGPAFAVCSCCWLSLGFESPTSFRFAWAPPATHGYVGSARQPHRVFPSLKPQCYHGFGTLTDRHIAHILLRLGHGCSPSRRNATKGETFVPCAHRLSGLCSCVCVCVCGKRGLTLSLLFLIGITGFVGLDCITDGMAHTLTFCTRTPPVPEEKHT